MPRFVPECFAYLHGDSPATYKRFREGLHQLLQEGVIQQFHQPGSVQRVPLLGAVGPLQFEVVKHRLQSEYNAESRLENASWQVVRWVRRKDDAPWSDEEVNLPRETGLARDELDRPVLLISDPWYLGTFTNRNPDIELSEAPYGKESDSEATVTS